jgi:hypothetical protein
MHDDTTQACVLDLIELEGNKNGTWIIQVPFLLPSSVRREAQRSSVFIFNIYKFGSGKQNNRSKSGQRKRGAIENVPFFLNLSLFWVEKNLHISYP